MREKFAVADGDLRYSAGVEVGLVRWERQMLLKRAHLPVSERQHSAVRTTVGHLCSESFIRATRAFTSATFGCSAGSASFHSAMNAR